MKHKKGEIPRATFAYARGFKKLMADQKRLFTGLMLALLAGWAGWYIYSGWGLVSLDRKDAPLREVLGSIGRQGGIRIESNLDPSTPVTIKVRRVPPLDALDIVAARTDSSWRLAYLGARDEKTIDAALAAFRLSQPTAAWTAHNAGGFPLVEPQSGAALDLRRVDYRSDNRGEDLHVALQKIAEGTGVFLAAPADWNPGNAAAGSGEIRRVVPALFAKLGGFSREVFLLRASPARPDGGNPDTEAPRRWGEWVGSNPAREGGRGGGMRGFGNTPDQAAARAEAQIALLPRAEQAEARKDLDAMRRFWSELRDLPEDQRRAKAQEFFSRPEIAERMEQRRLAREAKMTPEQRNQRSKRYFERKQAVKAGGGAQGEGGPR